MTRASDQERFYLGHSADSEGELFLVSACRHQFTSLVQHSVHVSVEYVIGFGDAEFQNMKSC